MEEIALADDTDGDRDFLMKRVALHNSFQMLEFNLATEFSYGQVVGNIELYLPQDTI